MNEHTLYTYSKHPPLRITAGEIKVEGDPGKLGELMGMLDEFALGFPIVEPKQANR